MGFVDWFLSFFFSSKKTFVSERKDEANAVQQLKSSDPKQRKNAVKTLEKDDNKEVSQLERIRQIEEEEERLIQKIIILEHEKEQLLGKAPKHSMDIITILNQFNQRLHAAEQKIVSEEQKIEQKLKLEKEDEKVIDEEIRPKSIDESKKLDSVEHNVDVEIATRTEMAENSREMDEDDI